MHLIYGMDDSIRLLLRPVLGQPYTLVHRRFYVNISGEEIDAKRQSSWTESIAVGGKTFIEPVKKAMGAMAKGRCLQPAEGAVERRAGRRNPSIMRFLIMKIAQ